MNHLMRYATRIELRFAADLERSWRRDGLTAEARALRSTIVEGYDWWLADWNLADLGELGGWFEAWPGALDRDPRCNEVKRASEAVRTAKQQDITAELVALSDALINAAGVVGGHSRADEEIGLRRVLRSTREPPDRVGVDALRSSLDEAPVAIAQHAAWSLGRASVAALREVVPPATAQALAGVDREVDPGAWWAALGLVLATSPSSPADGAAWAAWESARDVLGVVCETSRGKPSRGDSVASVFAAALAFVEISSAAKGGLPPWTPGPDEWGAALRLVSAADEETLPAVRAWAKATASWRKSGEKQKKKPVADAWVDLARTAAVLAVTAPSAIGTSAAAFQADARSWAAADAGALEAFDARVGAVRDFVDRAREALLAGQPFEHGLGTFSVARIAGQSLFSSVGNRLLGEVPGMRIPVMKASEALKKHLAGTPDRRRKANEVFDLVAGGLDEGTVTLPGLGRFTTKKLRETRVVVFSAAAELKREMNPGVFEEIDRLRAVYRDDERRSAARLEEELKGLGKERR